MRIAMIGQKGLPATWGGIEHHVEQIGARLADRGHEVVVYTRAHYTSAGLRESMSQDYRGMRLVPAWSAGTKHLDAITHSTASTLRAVRDHVDVVHYHAVGPGLLAPVPRYLSRSKVVLTVHGLDGDRDKWGGPAKLVLRTAEAVSARVPDATVVVSQALRVHYREQHGRPTTWIPNGVVAPAAPIGPPPFGLPRAGYVLFVGRFVPEKNPHVLLRAFRDVPGDVRLVLAGGSSFSDDYSDLLSGLAAQDQRVLLPGYVHGAELEALYAGAAAFVLPSSVEGLPLTLLEAASHGLPVIASDIAPNVEVLGADGPGRRVVHAGDQGALSRQISAVLADLDGERRGAAALRDDVLARYDWDAVTDQLEAVYDSVLQRRDLVRV